MLYKEKDSFQRSWYTIQRNSDLSQRKLKDEQIIVKGMNVIQCLARYYASFHAAMGKSRRFEERNMCPSGMQISVTTRSSLTKSVSSTLVMVLSNHLKSKCPVVNH